MKKVIILGRKVQSLEKVEQAVRDLRMEPIGCLTEVKFEHHVKNSAFDAVLIGPSVDLATRSFARTLARSYNPDAQILEHEAELESVAQSLEAKA